MNILNERQVKYARQEIKHYEEARKSFKEMDLDKVELKQETIDEQIASLDYMIRCRWDDIELTQALLSINIAHCKSVGIRFASLMESIKRNIGR